MKFIAIKTDDGTIKGKLTFYCRMLHVSCQGFYKYLSVKDRPWKYQALADTMLEIHAEDVCNDTYGRVRMFQALTLKQPDGIPIPSERTVYRVMEKIGLSHRPNAFGANDFNYRYLQEYLDSYDICNPPLGAPYIEFILTIGLEKDSNDRISNLIPFMLVEDIEDSELDICIRYEVEDFVYFQSEMKKLFSEGKDENAFSKFLNLLHNTDYVLKYYDKNINKIDVDFKLSNLMELQCIKANHLKNDHCLTDAFNKIINYRYDHIFQKEKKEVNRELEKINKELTENINHNHTEVIRNVLKELISMEHMGVDLSADITFDKLMRDLIKYEYIEDDANIPENQFGLGYTNLIMIIAAIMDYMERYPESSFNSKINLISIEEPETFMHPQMQELFIKNINGASIICLLLILEIQFRIFMILGLENV